ncbi:hypothetical protein Thermo_01688 [Thermoplasmatales archaeon]|nr:hypothetical protein Thermo_01688 [Thermoplasmatales archaeon]
MDYRESNPESVFLVEIDLPDVETVNEWLEMYRMGRREYTDDDFTVEDFLSFLTSHRIEAKLVKFNGTVIF